MKGDEVSIFFTGEGDVGKTTLICWCTYKSLNKVVINLGQKNFQIGGQDRERIALGPCVRE